MILLVIVVVDEVSGEEVVPIWATGRFPAVIAGGDGVPEVGVPVMTERVPVTALMTARSIRLLLPEGAVIVPLVCEATSVSVVPLKRHPASRVMVIAGVEVWCGAKLSMTR